MNRQEQNLRLQALLDGELEAADARAIEQWLAQDADARALFAELQQTRLQLAGNEAELRLPESREFFWSKIERDIRRLETAESGAPRTTAPLAWLRRWLAPAAAFAAVALAITFTQRPGSLDGANTVVEDSQEGISSKAYHDQAAGITMVWVSDQPDAGEGQPTEKNSIDNIEKQ
jgi:anti-sigma factor RsiW